MPSSVFYDHSMIGVLYITVSMIEIFDSVVHIFVYVEISMVLVCFIVAFAYVVVHLCIVIVRTGCLCFGILLYTEHCLWVLLSFVWKHKCSRIETESETH